MFASPVVLRVVGEIGRENKDSVPALTLTHPVLVFDTIESGHLAVDRTSSIDLVWRNTALLVRHLGHPTKTRVFFALVIAT